MKSAYFYPLLAAFLWLISPFTAAAATDPRTYLSFSPGVTATQTVRSDDGVHYTVSVLVRNSGSTAVSWKATLSTAVKLTSLTGAVQTTSNGVTTISGYGPLGAGKKTSWTYQAQRISSSGSTPPASSTPPPSTSTPPATTPPSYSHNGTSLSASSVASGQTLTITPKLTATAAASNMIVDIEIYDGAGTKLHQHYFSGQSFAANVTKSFPYSYTVNLAAGSYRVAVGLFDGAWGNKLWVNSAASFSVTSASATPTPAPAPSPTPAPAAGFKTGNGQIMNSAGQAIQIRGINMFGFNSDILAPQYLWAMNWKAQIQQVKDLGFNTIRVPFIPSTLHESTAGGIDGNLNPDLVGKTPQQIMDLWVAELSRQGLYFVLDFHSVSKKYQTNIWFTNDGSITWNGQPYTEDHWVADLVFLAKRYAANPHFMGIDLYNEPTGDVRWGSQANPYNPATDWKRAAEKAGNAILAANPNLIIFVEGISDNWDGVERQHVPINWGENLRPQAYAPINLPGNKIAFIPHTYGPDVFYKSTFDDPTFPNNLKADWEDLFGRFYPQYMVLMGEFGGRYGTGPTGQKDKVWQDAFVDYLISKNMRSGFYWCYSPNSHDTGGILDDNLQVVTAKMNLLHRLWGQ